MLDFPDAVLGGHGATQLDGPEGEAVLLEPPTVLEAAVVASPDPVKGHVPKAFVVLKPDVTPGPALVAELQEHSKRELAPYKYPRKIEFIDALPKTETGKIRRVELRRRAREQPGATRGLQDSTVKPKAQSRTPNA